MQQQLLLLLLLVLLLVLLLPSGANHVAGAAAPFPKSPQLLPRCICALWLLLLLLLLRLLLLLCRLGAAEQGDALDRGPNVGRTSEVDRW